MIETLPNNIIIPPIDDQCIYLLNEMLYNNQFDSIAILTDIGNKQQNYYYAILQSFCVLFYAIFSQNIPPMIHEKY